MSQLTHSWGLIYILARAENENRKPSNRESRLLRVSSKVGDGEICRCLRDCPSKNARPGEPIKGEMFRERALATRVDLVSNNGQGYSSN